MIDFNEPRFNDFTTQSKTYQYLVALETSGWFSTQDDFLQSVSSADRKILFKTLTQNYLFRLMNNQLRMEDFAQIASQKSTAFLSGPAINTQLLSDFSKVFNDTKKEEQALLRRGLKVLFLTLLTNSDFIATIHQDDPAIQAMIEIKELNQSVPNTPSTYNKYKNI